MLTVRLPPILLLTADTALHFVRNYRLKTLTVNSYIENSEPPQTNYSIHVTVKSPNRTLSYCLLHKPDATHPLHSCYLLSADKEEALL